MGVLSVASVASATRLAVMAADVTPRHSFVPLICSTLEIARSGFTTELEMGITVGSSVYTSGMPVVPSENARVSVAADNARRSSGVMASDLPTTYLPKARRYAGEPVVRIMRLTSPWSRLISRSTCPCASSLRMRSSGKVASSSARRARSCSSLVAAAGSDTDARTVDRSNTSPSDVGAPGVRV